MTERAFPDDPAHTRFTELNAVAGVLPYHRRAALIDSDRQATQNPGF